MTGENIAGQFKSSNQTVKPLGAALAATGAGIIRDQAGDYRMAWLVACAWWLR